MDITPTLKRIAAGALLAGGLVIPAMGYTAVVAHADDTFAPHHWCPGQDTFPPTGPGQVVWNWNVCHTFFFTNYGMGNVVNSYNGEGASVWDGDNPPPAAVTRRQCPPIAFMCP
jgi:hypothetical protein